MSDLLLQDMSSNDGQKLANAITDLRDDVRTLTAAVNTVAQGFPGGDADAHRRYHELLIEELEERRKLRRAIQEKTISGLVWAAIVGVSLAVWNEFVSHLGGGR